jgi:RNA polymerase sigma-70 factor (ECF subfamily)
MSTNEETIARTAFLKMPNRPETPDRPSATALPETELSSEQAFNDMYKAYGPLVHGILLARLPRDEVQDVLQDVFLSAFKNLNSLRNKEAVGGWLVRIARNHAADFYRSSRRTEELADDIPDRNHLHSEAAEVLKAIKSLPDAYCETLVLRLVEGMTGEEIARQTGRTPESVRVNLHRGMMMLRQKLGIEGKK